MTIPFITASIFVWAKSIKKFSPETVSPWTQTFYSKDDMSLNGKRTLPKMLVNPTCCSEMPKISFRVAKESSFRTRCHQSFGHWSPACSQTIRVSHLSLLSDPYRHVYYSNIYSLFSLYKWFLTAPDCMTAPCIQTFTKSY